MLLLILNLITRCEKLWINDAMKLGPVTQKTCSISAQHNRIIRQNKMKTFKAAGAPPSATQIQSSTHHGGETTALPVTLCLRAAWQPVPAICLRSKWFGCCAFLLWCGASLTLAVISLCKHVCPLPQLTLPPLLLLLTILTNMAFWYRGLDLCSCRIWACLLEFKFPVKKFWLFSVFAECVWKQHVHLQHLWRLYFTPLLHVSMKAGITQSWLKMLFTGALQMETEVPDLSRCCFAILIKTKTPKTKNNQEARMQKFYFCNYAREKQHSSLLFPFPCLHSHLWLLCIQSFGHMASVRIYRPDRVAVEAGWRSEEMWIIEFMWLDWQNAANSDHLPRSLFYNQQGQMWVSSPHWYVHTTHAEGIV